MISQKTIAKKESDRLYRLRNQERLRAKKKEWQTENQERHRAASQRWRDRNKEYSKEFYAKNKEQFSARNARWRQANKAKKQALDKAYAAAKPEVHRAASKRWRERNKDCPRYKIDGRMSTAIGTALRKKGGKRGRSWEALVGYTADDLKVAIERAFEAGMNWGRLLAGEIHIDHVIPKTKFNYKSTDDIEFKRCWALENLKPKWKAENLSKQAKIEHPSQIPLGV